MKLTSGQVQSRRDYEMNSSREKYGREGEERTDAKQTSNPMKRAPNEFLRSTTGEGGIMLQLSELKGVMKKLYKKTCTIDVGLVPHSFLHAA